MATGSKYSSFFEMLQGEAERDLFKEVVRVMFQELMEEELTRLDNPSTHIKHNVDFDPGIL